MAKKTNSIPYNFGGIEDESSHYDNSKVVILPVPYDKTREWIFGKFWNKLDASKGPAAIITASMNMEFYDIELGTDIHQIGIHTLPELGSENKPEEMMQKIYEACVEQLNNGKFITMIGGEHSISLGLAKALKEKHSGISCLQIDAHSDLRQEFFGTEYSHASVMRRIKEIMPIVQVGIRSQSKEEADFIKKNSLKLFYAKDILDDDAWMDEAVSMLTDDVFITIDLDGFDPSIMPSTGTPEPGGLQWHAVLKFMKKVFEKKNVVGFDVVELAPTDNVAPDFLAAKLVYKLIGYKFFK